MAATETEKPIIRTSAPPPPHFVLVPLFGQGHTIPMGDLACLLAERGVRVSVVTTPVNAARLQGVADRARRAMLPLEIVELPFPPADDGLPPGSASGDNVIRLFLALYRLAGPLEAYLRALPWRPSCIISDSCNPWTAGVARSVGVPRLFFNGPSCFYSLCRHNVATHGLLHDGGDTAYVVPGMPLRVEMTKETWSAAFLNCMPKWEAFLEDVREGMRTADGAVVNTFLGLEEQFVACYEAGLGKPVWALGPFFLNNRDEQALATRVDKDKPSAVDQSAVTAWLDTMEQSAVIYVCFGSLPRMLLPKQLYEVGHGLVGSGKPFLWVVKESETASPEAQEWLQAFEARTAGKGLVMRGWVSQLAILSHRAIGGFVTHCGWNSLLESVALGVPVVTWPHFGDQFLNELLAVEVLGVGVPVRDAAVTVAPVLRGHIARAVSELMGGGTVAQERRRKCKEYGERAHRAIAKGGSSHQNLTQLLQSFMPSGSKEFLDT
ncbi:UDP-glycosyltransferase 73C4-like [Lolium perenne]|uniref:UDP-glycosyltransferase 73C4-like n=1 Tax=Lolium perenne TaxID=4522 RepID=UPI0021EA51DB|nr:UDP-glycosyltransferase 73C1-like [Lolium perenne]